MVIFNNKIEKRLFNLFLSALYILKSDFWLNSFILCKMKKSLLRVNFWKNTVFNYPVNAFLLAKGGNCHL
jgi:hypothetical protein